MTRAILIALSFLLLASPAAGQASSIEASAAGTASLTLTDWETGTTVCAGGAAFALEVNPFTGVLAWASPHCGEPGVATFTFWCTDACFHDCWFHEGEMTCWNEGTTLDGTWFTDQATLRRDGAFTFQRDVGWTTLRAEGNLVVTTWPDGA